MRSLSDAFRVLARNKWLSVGIFCAVLGCVVAGLAFAPRTYISEARLFVRVGRESVTLDPTATVGQNIAVYESRESELSSVLDVIQSRVVVEHVVDSLGPSVVLGRSPLKPAELRTQKAEIARGNQSRKPGGLSPRIVAASVAAPTDDLVLADESSNVKPASNPETPKPAANTPDRTAGSEREQAIQMLDKALSVSHGKKSNVVVVSCKASSPELAQRMVDLVLEAFREQHMRINRTQGSHEFFVEQERVSKQELNQATRQLRDAKNALELTSVEGQRKSLQDQMSVLNTARAESESLLASAKASADSLRTSLARLPEKQITQEVSGFPNDSRDRTRQQFNDLRLRERELLTKYTEIHPQVLAVRRQITEAEAILNRREAPITQSVSAATPAYQQLHLRLLEEEARIASLEARIKAQTEHQDELQVSLKQLNDHEGQIDMLQKKVDLLQAAHRGYQEKREQARVDKELENERISNINIVQPATYMPRAIGPKKPIVLGLGIFAALCASIAIPLAREFIRPPRPEAAEHHDLHRADVSHQGFVQV